MNYTHRYIVGFISSLLLTLTAYAIVWAHTISGHLLLSHTTILALLLALALVQFVVQLAYFLHLGEKGERDRFVLFCFALLAVLILSLGSLWVMGHLNARMLADPQLMLQYMQREPGL